MNPISASANSAASTKRIFVLGTMLDGAFQRLTTRNKAQGALTKAGQNNRAGKVDIASAMVSYMGRRFSTFSTPTVSKQRGQMWRAATAGGAQVAHKTA